MIVSGFYTLEAQGLGGFVTARSVTAPSECKPICQTMKFVRRVLENKNGQARPSFFERGEKSVSGSDSKRLLHVLDL